MDYSALSTVDPEVQNGFSNDLGKVEINDSCVHP